VCDVDSSATVTAADALRVLEYAVGISVELILQLIPEGEPSALRRTARPLLLPKRERCPQRGAALARFLFFLVPFSAASWARYALSAASVRVQLL
jgi:hypothetical protein